MVNKLQEKITQLEAEYNAIDLREDEIELDRRRQAHDSLLNQLNTKRALRETKLNELQRYREALEVFQELENMEEV